MFYYINLSMSNNTKQNCMKCNSISETGLYKTKAMHILQQCDPVISVTDMFNQFTATILASGLTLFPCQVAYSIY
jgi:hypothetical protein